MVEVLVEEVELVSWTAATDETGATTLGLGTVESGLTVTVTMLVTVSVLVGRVPPHAPAAPTPEEAGSEPPPPTAGKEVAAASVSG